MSPSSQCLRCSAPLPAKAGSPFCPACLTSLGRADWLASPTPDPTAGPGPGPRELPRFGNYELLAEIARGGMGVVYRARQSGLDRIVALKMIRAGVLASELEIARFQSEARATASLRHPGIIAIHEIGELDDRHYFSMDFVEGRNLAQLVRERPLPFRRAAACVRAVAEAIQYAHDRGILHRDLKPSNVIVDELGEPHVTDFGLATRIQDAANLTLSGVILGTPSYMAPEQTGGRRSEIAVTTDVYALGAILFELITGRPPFQGETTLDTIRLVRDSEPVPPRRLNPRVPRDLETICLKCLEKDPNRRYASARALAGDLARFLADQPIQARPAPFWEHGRKWVRRNPWRAALAATAVLAASAGLWLGLERAANRELRATNARVVAARQAEADQRREAETMRDQLGVALAAAEEARNDANRQHYVNGIGLAHRDWEANHLEEAELRLEACPEEFRDWEWRYLKRLCRNQAPTFRISSNLLREVSLSQDGFRVASRDRRGTLRLLDLRAGTTLTLTNANEINVTAFGFADGGASLAVAHGPSPTEAFRFLDLTGAGSTRALPVSTQHPFLAENGPSAGQILFDDHHHLLIAAQPKVLVALDARSGDIRWRLPLAEPQAPALLAASADGQVLASATGPRKLTADGSAAPSDDVLRLQAMSTGALLLAWTNRTDPFHALALSPDVAILATGHDGGEIRTWNVKSNTPLASFRHGHGAIQALAFSGDGRHLISGSTDGTLAIRPAASGDPAESRVYRGHAGPIRLVGAQPDGATVVAVDETGTVRLWKTGHPQEASKFTDTGQTVAFASDDLVVSSGGGIYSAGTNALLRIAQGGPNIRVSASAEAGMICLANRWFSLTNGSPVSFLGLPTNVSHTYNLCSTFSADGRHFATATGSNVLVLDTRTGREVNRFPTGMGPESRQLIHAFAFGPDPLLAAATGDWIANGLNDVGVPGEALVFNWRTGARAASIPTRRFAAWDVKFSPDGRRLATSGGLYTTAAARRSGPDRRPAPQKQGEIQVWDVGSWREIFDLPGITDNVFSLDFSPDGNRLAAAVGKSGSSLQGTPGELKIWELERGSELLSLRAFPGPVTGVAFSPDGKRLAAVGSKLLQIFSAE